MSTSEFDKYKVDHLFLLIGENPLPNYVAAKTLLAEGGKPYLVFTEHTQKPAERLQEALGLSDNEMVPLDNNESNAGEIKKRIRCKIKEIQGNSAQKKFGLNYTGGTKAMAVHAYQALLQPKLEGPTYKLEPEPIFSYLDSHRLEMLIDQKQGNSLPIYDFRSKVQLLLEEVFDLHEPWHKNQPPVETPKLPELAKEIASLHKDVNVARAWRWWCDHVLRPKARNPQKPGEWLEEKHLKNLTIPLQSSSAESNVRDVLSSISNKINQENSLSLLDIFQENDFEKIREVAQLSSYLWSSLNTVHIEKIVTCIQKSLDLSGDELSLTNASSKGGFNKIKHLCKWLDGEWLEHYVLQQVKNISSSYSISDSRMSFHIPDNTNNDKFEFDVAFMRNYQLFALSCTTDTEPGLCKLKLFEAYRRARQMGGDEARVALVCCYDKPEKIKKGFMSQIPNDKVNVFGLGDLTDLSEKLKTWIQEVDK